MEYTPKTYNSFEEYPAALDAPLWLDYNTERTIFTLWSPVASTVKISLYRKGKGGEKIQVYNMSPSSNGIWSYTENSDLAGYYYTYQIKVNGKWLDETPGIYTKAVGVNGDRAMILDLSNTNPEGWVKDKGPALAKMNDAIIYELQVRDITIHNTSGSSAPGKYLGLVESGTTGPNEVATGIDHIKELGVTHVHLLPAFDNYSIDESKLDSAQYNWGYDPKNYNVPEGSFSSDPYDGSVRIKEFKQMVKSFHDNGMGVILDVVYNHTGRTDESNFNLEVPGYYYRQNEDGTWSNASACGNETASEREMMRKYMVESVSYWAKEYHLDGFRFDLMGIHDIETMNAISAALKAINPDIIIYGEGWTAGGSPLHYTKQALKMNTHKLDGVAAFSDELRDGIKGSVFDDMSTGFVSGAKDTESSIKFGVVGAIDHNQVDEVAVNYTDTAWAREPWQSVAYVSCHDNHTLYDKLKISQPDASEEEITAMQKLANGIVLTSQGIAFLHAGSEFMRTKNGEHNSYNLPDEINQIDWNRKVENLEVFEFYMDLIALRKVHPAFHMATAQLVNENLKFLTSQDGLIGFQLNGDAVGDEWKQILVYYNANTTTQRIDLAGSWKVALFNDKFVTEGENTLSKNCSLPPVSLTILYQD